MKSIQLGGILVKGKFILTPKLIGTARYRGTKEIEVRLNADRMKAASINWVAPRA
ncbi:hypothetical protein [Paenibacillus sp. 453mf]|uniref:hypothetical protein n=1 Tax=Paenibacillus sp. 453mf TaxID=1761874 RepID=UPI00147EA29B|nr:hypothetical protein [Paenibacillus sp. 453mf]